MSTSYEREIRHTYRTLTQILDDAAKHNSAASADPHVQSEIAHYEQAKAAGPARNGMEVIRQRLARAQQIKLDKGAK